MEQDRATKRSREGCIATAPTIITFLMQVAYSQPQKRRSALRLGLLLTHPQHWRGRDLAISQQDLAELWNVSLRSARRELSRLKTLGWIEDGRKSAPGYIAEYRLLPLRVRLACMPCQERGYTQTASASDTKSTILLPTEAGFWDWFRNRVQCLHPDLDPAWFAPLSVQTTDARGITLLAPNRFHAAHLADRLLPELATELGIPPTALRDIRLVTPAKIATRETEQEVTGVARAY